MYGYYKKLASLAKNWVTAVTTVPIPAATSPIPKNKIKIRTTVSKPLETVIISL